MSQQALENWAQQHVQDGDTLVSRVAQYPEGSRGVEIDNADGEPVIRCHNIILDDHVLVTTFEVAADRQQNGTLRSFCAFLGPWARENDRTIIRVNGPVSAVMRDQLAQMGFAGDENAGWQIDVSEPNNGLERYGSS